MSFHGLTHRHKNFSFTNSALSKPAMRWLCALNLLHLAHLRHVFAAPGGNKAYQIRQDAVQKLFDPMTEVFLFSLLGCQMCLLVPKNVWSRRKLTTGDNRNPTSLKPPSWKNWRDGVFSFSPSLIDRFQSLDTCWLFFLQFDSKKSNVFSADTTHLWSLGSFERLETRS